MRKKGGGVADALSSSTTSTRRPIRILCYGDSLTAGDSPPSFEKFPYAPHLESSLNNVVVRHRGLPGWTASQMVQDIDGQTAGLRTAIRAVTNPPLSVVIILAGTNDLGYESVSSNIINSILTLHRTCYEENIKHTIAIGIPPSGYQSISTDAAALANEVNTALLKHCQSNAKQSTFIPFPFTYSKDSNYWAPDGLHFSPQGYEYLGKSIAPVVDKVLQSLNENED